VQIDAHGVSAAQVEGDRDALTRVVRNLLDNAERYAASTVIVAVRENHQNAELVVRDDGPGIPEELRIRVFERFTRADDARARTTGGAGLGLAIAHAIVVAHGGRIAISDQGPGAAFVVQLPLATT
jgi:signal transduction histidine kinase